MYALDVEPFHGSAKAHAVEEIKSFVQHVTKHYQYTTQNPVQDPAAYCGQTSCDTVVYDMDFSSKNYDQAFENLLASFFSITNGGDFQNNDWASLMNIVQNFNYKRSAPQTPPPAGVCEAAQNGTSTQCTIIHRNDYCQSPNATGGYCPYTRKYKDDPLDFKPNTNAYAINCARTMQPSYVPAVKNCTDSRAYCNNRGHVTDERTCTCQCDYSDVFTGDVCDVPNCQNSFDSCQNGGTSIPSADSSQCECSCPAFYAGPACAEDLCAVGANKHCTENHTSSAVRNGTECTCNCRQGFIGATCETRVTTESPTMTPTTSPTTSPTKTPTDAPTDALTDKKSSGKKYVKVGKDNVRVSTFAGILGGIFAAVILAAVIGVAIHRNRKKVKYQKGP